MKQKGRSIGIIWMTVCSFGMNVSIVLLDLNACVGDEVVEDMVDRHRVAGRNENGERII